MGRMREAWLGCYVMHPDLVGWGSGMQRWTRHQLQKLEMRWRTGEAFGGGFLPGISCLWHNDQYRHNLQFCTSCGVQPWSVVPLAVVI